MAEAETSTTTNEAAPAGTTDGALETGSENSTILGGGDTSDGGNANDTLSGGNGEDSLSGGNGEDSVAAAAAADPVIPDAYDLTPPDGFTLDPALIASVTDDFKGAKLTNDQAQALMPAAVKFAEHLKQQGEQQLISSVLAERKVWAAEAKADPDIGGAKWDETLALSARALDALPENVGTPLRSLLNDSGLGNKREMIAAMSFFGRAIGEDSTIRGTGSDVVAKPVAHQLYPDDAPKGGN